MAETSASGDIPALLAGTLLPGDGVRWPSAGALGLGPEIARLLPAGQAEQLAAALPTGLAAADAAARTAACARLETARPDLFAALFAAACQAYYGHAEVRAVVLALSLARAGGPLQPFDPARLDPVRRRAAGPAANPAPADTGARHD